MDPSLPSQAGPDALPTSLPPYIGAVMFETFLYGLYAVLFTICTYVLLHRNKTLHWVLLVSAIMMFSLATTDIVYTYYILFGKLFKGGLTFTDLRPKYWFYVTNNAIADSLLLYRCFVVWEFKKRVAILPVLILLGVTGCGYVLEGSSSKFFDKSYIYLVMTFGLNVTLTGLTAGRIWWLKRKAHLILNNGLLQRYNATITILIESGFLYSVYIILDLALRNTNIVNTILDAGLIQVVGIMPTLIIVQVSLERAVHDIEAQDTTVQQEASKRASTKSYPENVHRMSYPEKMHCARARESQTHWHFASSETFVVQYEAGTEPRAI